MKNWDRENISFCKVNVLLVISLKFSYVHVDKPQNASTKSKKTLSSHSQHLSFYFVFLCLPIIKCSQLYRYVETLFLFHLIYF